MSDMSSDLDIHKTISLIYTTAADPEQWPELLNALANFVDTLQSGYLERNNLEQEENNSTISLGRMLMNSSLATELEKLPGLNKDENSNAHSLSDVSSVLISHFKSALQVSQRLIEYEDQKDMVASLLERLPVAIITVDENANVFECNNQAQEILKKGSTIYLANNRLITNNKEITRKLHNTISKVSKSAPSSINDRALMLSYSYEGQDDMMAYLSPIKGSDISDSPRVAIFISRPKSQPLILPSSFVQLYKLTNKESEIASFIVRGYSAREIATELTLSENTIRTHQKSIFQKTGINRQTDLIRLVLGGPNESTENRMLPSDNMAAFGFSFSDSVRIIKLADGRKLAYQEYGVSNGIPIIFLHSVRGSHLEIENLAANAARAKGLRLIAPDRPGFGLSDPKHLDSVLDYAQDIETLANELELEKFNIAGYVLGGLFAKAVAYTMPERVEKLLLISCGVTAKTAEDFHGMIPLYKMSHKLAHNMPKILRMLSSTMVRGMLRNPERFFEQFATQLEPQEAALFKSKNFRTKIINSLQEAANQGSKHIAREVELLNHPWGFSPADISVPTLHWHGEKDRHVPYILAKKLAALQQNSQLRVIPDGGHFMAYIHMHKIFEEFINS